MKANTTIGCFVLLLANALEISTESNHVIQDIGYQLCPYANFCQRNATQYYSPIFRRPCCSDCSCEDRCWETANCCPDKEVFENKDPVTKCITDIVKKADGFSKEKWGYHVINYCPITEKNATLVTKCTAKEARDFEELIWVSDDISGKIYRNKFCAECHHVTSNVTEWPIEAKCTNDIYTRLDNLMSFFLSNKCQLTIKQPGNFTLKSCMVPKYTTCNQTGLWHKFDADVKWACQAFEAVFTARGPEGRDATFEAYRNAYCYVCNTDVSVEITETLCPVPSFEQPDVSVFTSLIDYKRYQQSDDQESTTETTCKTHEILDEIMHKCRVLKCPFGSSPVNGKCKSLFDGTSGLYINIPFSLGVIWSRSEYKLSDTRKTLRLLGEQIIEQVINIAELERNGSVCPYCYLELQMTADVPRQAVRTINRNDVNNDVTDAVLDINEATKGVGKVATESNEATKGVGNVATESNEATKGVGNVAIESNEQQKMNEEPTFILKTVLFTLAECQLQNIFDIATDVFGKIIDLQVDGETEMQLTVGLLKDNLPANQTLKVIKKMNSEVWDCKVKGAHTLKDEKFCSKIAITFNEFEPHLNNDNREIISTFFQKKHIETGETTEVCVDNYYERLQSIDFHMFSYGSAIKDTIAFNEIISVIALLRWLNLRHYCF